MLFGADSTRDGEPLHPPPLPNVVKSKNLSNFPKIDPGKILMPPAFFGSCLRQKNDQKRRLSGWLSRIHFCDLIHGGGLVFGLHAIVASPAGRDQSRDDASRGRKHFNPRVPCGTRRGGKRKIYLHAQFQPTRPLRDATALAVLLLALCLDFYPRVPCGTRPSLRCPA